MQKAKKDSKRKSLLKWILLGVAVLLLGVGGYFGYKYYQDYQANKVYSVGETVGLSDFKVDITKAEFKSVDLPIDKVSTSNFLQHSVYSFCS
jgi:predicted negative regulator of RcsB-dependent stress response